LKNTYGRLEIRIPRGLLVRGGVRREDGTPMADARVDFFFRAIGKAGGLADATQPYAVALAATAVTDKNGKFAVEIPHIDPQQENAFGLPDVETDGL